MTLARAAVPECSDWDYTLKRARPRMEAEFELGDGSREAARRVLLATGMDYRFPALPGIAERWGRSAFHCPFCHGWEVRDQPLGVLDRGAPGVQRALLLRVWSDDVTLLADGPAELDAEEVERLRAAGVAVDERRVDELRGPDSALTAVAFADGGERPCGGLLVPVTLHQRSALAEQLGAAASGPGPSPSTPSRSTRSPTPEPRTTTPANSRRPRRRGRARNLIGAGHLLIASVLRVLYAHVVSKDNRF
jgi:thioredoxin reductase